jgi:uncharacterized protein (TIGR03083 family)
MTELTPATVADEVEALWDRFDAVLADLDEDDWHRPVPSCPGWDVHDLVGHIGGLTTMFAGLPQPEPPAGWAPPEGAGPIDSFTEAAVAARRGRTPRDQLEELALARRTWTDGLRALPDLDGEAMGPTGKTTQREFVRVRLFDLWHHLWDLHAALGKPFDLTDDSLAAVTCHGYVLQRVPFLYGKRAGAPEWASVRLRLGVPLEVDRSVIVSDGRADWTDVPAADTVEGPAAAFTLTITGRLDDEARTASGLQARGPEAERLLGARLFG